MNEAAIVNRYEFVIIFDVENGNPNGDPDAGNMPRMDAETGHGIVTDVCLKRKIRNYIQLLKKDEPPYSIFIKEVLNETLCKAYSSLGIEKKTKKADEIKLAQQWMCKNYYDVRAFGAVMSTGDCPCGVVRGPIQINFAKSIDPIAPHDFTVTRMAVTTTKDHEAGKETEMGKKSFVPYALYKAEGFVSGMLAQNVTGFSEDDLELFWEAIVNMFEHDRSAARGKMIVRKLIIFKHDGLLGNAPSHTLLERVQINRKDKSAPPRAYSDYYVSINREDLPNGVSIHERV